MAESRGARPGWRPRLGWALDVLCAVLAGGILLILFTGGISVRLLGVRISAHHLVNPLLLLGALAATRWALGGGPRTLAARLGRDRTAAILLGIALLATAARAPGLFWGYRLFGTMSIPYLQPDEAKYSRRIAVDILTHRPDLDNPHPPEIGRAHV